MCLYVDVVALIEPLIGLALLLVLIGVSAWLSYKENLSQYKKKES